MARRHEISWKDQAALSNLAAQMRVIFRMDGAVNRVHVAIGEDALEEVTEEIRTPAISQGTSKISTHPEVRAALFNLQREMGRARRLKRPR